MGKSMNFEIIVGTYEEFVIGYRFNSEKKDLVQSFASHSHNASVRCIAHSENYLATGGADERIVIYDLKSRKEQCTLNHHNATVNCLKFTDGHTHLISGGSDGILAITRVGNWKLEKIWEKAHKGSAIIDVAIHPSNKLALTLGADCSLRTWNLIKGRQAYAINLNSKSKDAKSLQFIKWCPDGIRFILCGGFHTDIWNIETGGIVKPIEHKNKVTYCLFYDNDILVIGFENGYLSMLNLDNEECKEVQAHTARIKSIDICKKHIITCSSNGEVTVWNKHLEKVSTCNTGCRHTCINVVLPTWIKKEENLDIIEDENNIVEISMENDSNTIVATSKGVVDKKNQVKVIIEDEVLKKKRPKKTDIQVEIEKSAKNSKVSDKELLKSKQKKITVKSPEKIDIEKAVKKKRKSVMATQIENLNFNVEEIEHTTFKKKKKQKHKINKDEM